MANQYFKFKQFILHQDRCAMKVCTDACLFGAWVASLLEQKSFSNENFPGMPRHILDIGSGTGLLIMMLAQKTFSKIDGVEIEPGCYNQLEENTSQNEWKERIQLFNTDIRTFKSSYTYDLIISNPPFFENDLDSATGGEQLAKHSKELNLEELIESIDHNLGKEGRFSVLLPFHRVAYFEKSAAKKGFYPIQKMLVRQTDKHGFFRGMLSFSRSYQPCTTEEMNIRQNNEYSPAFISLLKDYYLYL